ncbi:MAG: TolC family protein [Deltaproteobacteria bacterium]|nr:TolC family protein [Deltaproteobacteria bacterium]
MMVKGGGNLFGRKGLVRPLLLAGIMLCLFSCMKPQPALETNYIGPVRQETPGETAREESIQPVQTETGPMQVTVRDAILMTLENNRSLAVEKMNPEIRRAEEEIERALFDPVIGTVYSRYREKRDAAILTTNEKLTNEVDAGIGVSAYLPTGTGVEVGFSTEESWSDLYSDDLHASRLGVSVTQALLQGGGLGYNLAALRQARLQTRATEYELRGFAEALVADIEETYWDYALTQRQIAIYCESLNLAEKQKSETEEMIRIGSLAESELVAAEAEIALRREGLINARSTLEKTRLRLLRLLNPPGENPWRRDVVLLDQPVVPDARLDDVEAHVAVALRMRPDLNESRVQEKQGDLEVVKTKNGLLPKMDFFISLGKTGYAESFGSSVGNIDGDSYDITAGVTLAYPIINRDERARHRRSLITAQQRRESVKNLAQLVQVDVRSAYIEVMRAKEQLSATEATRKLQEEKVRVETEKFHVGKSTTLLVAQAHRDLLESRISETRAVANYLKALVELYRLEGSLLERRGIVSPGAM